MTTSGGPGSVAKYNPHLLSAEELKNIFVARKSELNWLFNNIRDSEPGQSHQHCLIVGQRGMGKTTLLRRIGLMVEEDQELSQSWLALNFPEEQYTVSNCGELWSNVVGSLADTLEARQLSTRELDRKLMALDTCPKDALEEKALEIVNSYCEKHHKRLLLLVDSTDLLLDNLHERKTKNSDNNLWRLRNVLMHNPNIMWLGASYKALELDNQYKDSFQDFFHPVELSPMTLKEMQAAMETLAATFGTGAGLTGEQAVAELRKTMTKRPERLKTLRHLTGGIPRTTVKLYELFAGSDSNNVRQDLERLLDDMTPLYKARLEALPDQARKIFAHIMEYWDPISIATLSDVSRLENSKLSSQLKRLEMDGLVAKTSLPDTKVSGYQAAERFFNIWYLMRNAPRRLKLRLSWLIEFLRIWYQEEELEHIARQRLWHLRQSKNNLPDLEYSRALAASMPKGHSLRSELDMETYQQLNARNINLTEFYDLDGEDKPFASLKEYQDKFQEFKAKLDSTSIKLPEQDLLEWKDLLLFNIQLTLPQKQALLEKIVADTHPGEIIESLRRQYVANDYEKQYLQNLKQVADYQGFCLDFIDNQINSTQLKSNLPNNPVLWEFLLKWQDQLQQDCLLQLVEFSLKNKIAISTGIPKPGLAKLASKLTSEDATSIALMKNIESSNWRTEDLLHLFEQCFNYPCEKNLLNNLSDSVKDKLNSAWEWYDYGRILGENAFSLQDSQLALNTVIELNDDIEATCSAWDGLGNLYQYHLQEYQKALQAYQKAIELDQNYASPWNGLGNLYQEHLHEVQKAQQAYQKAIELDQNFAYPWDGLGNLYLDHLHEYEKAQQAYQKAITLDQNFAQAWNGLGGLYLDHLHEYEKAEQAFNKALQLQNINPFIIANIARCQWNLHKIEKSLNSFQSVIEFSNNQKHQPLLLQAHLMLNNQGLAQKALEGLAEQAGNQNNLAFLHIKVQCWELQPLGKGVELADLMASSSYADYLRPFEIALRYCNDNKETIKGFAPEIQELALDIVSEIEKRLPKTKS